jgi:hypothetical protein
MVPNFHRKITDNPKNPVFRVTHEAENPKKPGPRAFLVETNEKQFNIN